MVGVLPVKCVQRDFAALSWEGEGFAVGLVTRAKAAVPMLDGRAASTMTHNIRHILTSFVRGRQLHVFSMSRTEAVIRRIVESGDDENVSGNQDYMLTLK